MKVLVGFETSGRTREAFRRRGCDAWSCDILPADDGSPHHLRGDIWDHVDPAFGWDLAIFHPVCTYLASSAEWAYGDGPYHQKVRPGTLVGAARREARERSLDQVRRLMRLPYPHVIENPKGAISTRIRKPDDIVQPYEFGDDASKETHLWLYRLRPLVRDPAMRVAGRVVDGVERWSNQTDSGQNRLAPGADRWKERSRTYPGIAEALAGQYGRDDAIVRDLFDL